MGVLINQAERAQPTPTQFQRRRVYICNNENIALFMPNIQCVNNIQIQTPIFGINIKTLLIEQLKTYAN